MTKPDSKLKLNTQVYEEAAAWLVELRVDDVDAAARERLDAWFRSSPEHVRAFLELSSIWEDGATAELDRNNSTDALIARARGMTNVIPLESRRDSPAAAGEAESVSARPPAARKSRKMNTAIAAAFAFACLAGALGAWLYGVRNPTYVTQTGEQRSIQLIDGSMIELNSRTRVRIRFSEHERDVDLLAGQALFRVAKDHTRPFVVHSNSTLVRAVGTQFDVYRKTSGTTVTVVEGRVAVSDGRAPANSPGLPPPHIPDAGARPGAAASVDVAGFSDAQALILSAGEQVTITPAAAARPAPADVAVATAWTQRRLIFDSTPLTDVAAEFNRYNVRPLTISDGTLNTFLVSGVFSSADTASLLRFLRTQQGINIEETDTEIRISRQ
jgi:transmembrane sensor